MIDAPPLSVLPPQVDAPAGDFVSELLARLPANECFDARSLLDAHPEFRGVKSVVLDLALEEFCRKEAAGERADPHSFAAKFPRFERSLLHLLEVRDFVEANARALIGGEVRWPEPGERFLNYQLEEFLGRGAFSKVFLARQMDVGERRVVLKVCQHYSIEADMLGRLEHPQIVPAYSPHADPEGGLWALCMPFLGRATLFDLLDSASSWNLERAGGKDVVRCLREANPELDGAGAAALRRSYRGTYVDAVVRMAVQLVDALVFTHEKGFCHLDIKPSNVLLTNDGRAMLLDFNLARRVASRAAAVGGTVPYMSPEQLRWLIGTERGEEAPGASSDIFSLGAMLYEALTGRLPFPLDPQEDREQAGRKLLERQQAGPLPLRTLNRTIDARLAATLEGCLAFDPAERVPSAAVLRKRLRQALSARARLTRWVSRRRKQVLAVAGAAALCSGAGFGFWSSLEPYAIRELKQGQTLFAAQQFGLAIAHFEAGASRDPQNAELHFWLGRARLARGEVHEAEREFRTVATLPGDGRTAARAAFELCRANYDLALATELGEWARGKGYESAALYNNLAVCYLRTGKVDSADRAIRRSLELEAAHPVILHNLLRLNLQKSVIGVDRPGLDVSSWLAEAVRVLKQVENLGAASPELLLDGARVYVLQSLTAPIAEQPACRREAFRTLRKAVELRGGPVDALVPPEAQANLNRSLVERTAAALGAGKSALILEPQ